MKANSEEIDGKSTHEYTFGGLQRCRWQCRSIFIRLAVVTSEICEIARNFSKIRTYSSSRSFHLIDLGDNRKRIYT